MSVLVRPRAQYKRKGKDALDGKAEFIVFTKIQNVVDDIKIIRLRWASHIIRIEAARIQKIYLMESSTTQGQ
jgi:hypothetical protein